MMARGWCPSVSIKVTKFQQSSANRFRALAKKLPGGGGGANLPLNIKQMQNETNRWSIFW